MHENFKLHTILCAHKRIDEAVSGVVNALLGKYEINERNSLCKLTRDLSLLCFFKNTSDNWK
jgi:hypothetical protein